MNSASACADWRAVPACFASGGQPSRAEGGSRAEPACAGRLLAVVAAGSPALLRIFPENDRAPHEASCGARSVAPLVSGAQALAGASAGVRDSMGTYARSS
jgi:hypothetical protein